MKKILFLMLASLLGTQHINAQDNTAEYGIFNHLGAAVSVGTDGIGFDVASPLTNYVALRAGVSFWPKIKFSHNFRINDNNPLITDNVDVEAKTNIFNCKLLADIYPSKHDGFHFTIGAFVGNDDVVNATNTSMFWMSGHVSRRRHTLMSVSCTTSSASAGFCVMRRARR